MLKVVSWFVIGFVTYIFDCYVFSELAEEKKFKITKTMLLLSLILALITCYSVYFCIEFRTFIVNLSAIMLFMLCYKKSIVTCSIVDIYMFLIMSISEIIFVMIFSWIFGVDVTLFTQSIPWMFISNFVILLITFLIIKSLKIKKFKVFIDRTSNKWNDLNIIFLVILSLIIVSILLYPISTTQLPRNLALTYTTIFFTGIVFMVAFFNAKNKQNKISNEYEFLFKYVKIYEDLIEEKCKQQHENRNQLIIIKSNIDKKNKKAVEYIDKLLDVEDDEKDYNYLNKLKGIPNGIKGLIFYKVEEMKKLGIDVYLDIGKFDKKSVILCEDNLNDLSRILGVYLDNAKEAATLSDKKYVVIELSIDNGVNFEISNTYKNNTNIERIGKKGFSTKGIGRGYGLSLVRDVVSKNKNFERERQFKGIFYVQKLKLKNKSCA